MALTHVAMPYDTDERFSNTACPFLAEGVDLGEAVLAVTCDRKTDLLQREFGGKVRYVDRALFYEHPARLVSQVLDWLDEEARNGRRIRLLGEPPWRERWPLQTSEWHRVEALVNLVLGETDATIMCPYHLGLPMAVLESARRTHPKIMREGKCTTNPAYLPPEIYAAMCDRAPLPPAPAHAVELPVRSPDLREARALVTTHAPRSGLVGDALHQLLVAVTEVAANALTHGAPPVWLRLWEKPGALVCEVADQGHWRPADRASLGWLPPGTDGSPGLGLWAVRMLCGMVQIRTGPEGTRVRIHTPLDL